MSVEAEPVISASEGPRKPMVTSSGSSSRFLISQATTAVSVQSDCTQDNFLYLSRSTEC
jgi:hypothetical protein